MRSAAGSLTVTPLQEQTERDSATTRHRRLKDSISVESTGNASSADQSDRSSCFSSPSPSPNKIDLIVIEAKHELIETLMKDVYAIFDSGWTHRPRTCAPMPSDSHGTQPSYPQGESSSASQKGKRRMQDRESPPPHDGNGKRRRRGGSSVGPHRPNRPYACPFHKYDPRKYSLNGGTGATYRSCLGPGFTSIARLK